MTPSPSRNSKAAKLSSYGYADKEHDIAVDPVDPEGNPLCLAAYINDPLGAFPHNAEFQVNDDEVQVVTTDDIPKHAEVFLHYSREYWTDLHIPRTLREGDAKFYASPAAPRSTAPTGIG